MAESGRQIFEWPAYDADITELLRCGALVCLAYVWGKAMHLVLRTPPYVGELFAGFVLGPSLLDVIPHTRAMQLLGIVGVLLIAFEAGLCAKFHIFRWSYALALAVAICKFLPFLPCMLSMIYIYIIHVFLNIHVFLMWQSCNRLSSFCNTTPACSRGFRVYPLHATPLNLSCRRLLSCIARQQQYNIYCKSTRQPALPFAEQKVHCCCWRDKLMIRFCAKLLIECQYSIDDCIAYADTT